MHTLLDARIARSLTLVVTSLVIILVLVWQVPPSAPAAASEGIQTVFLGSLTGSATTDPGPADALFTTLAAQATTSIDVMLYDFDRAGVRDALLAAHNRGVTVRVVGDNEAAENPDDKPFYESLTAAGIPVVLDDRSSLQHNKVAVFDDAVTWTGSANFSDTAFTRNGEHVMVITSTVVADIYRTEFAEMFGGAFSTAKTDNTVHTTTVNGAPVEIAFAPTDQVQQRIIDALNTADVSIRVAMFVFTNDDIGQALIAAHQRGVTVAVLLDGRSDGSQYSERDPLCAAGVTVRMEDWAGTLHTKYAVIDANTTSNPQVITGSTNWTLNGVTANDENLLIIRDAALATAFAQDMARLQEPISAAAFACNVAAPGDPFILPQLYLPLVVRAQPPTPTPTPTATPTATTPPVQASPTPTATATATPTVGQPRCDASYPDVCIPPPPPDLNCSDISERRFRVLPPDPHDFDRDGDGVGCESG